MIQSRLLSREIRKIVPGRELRSLRIVPSRKKSSTQTGGTWISREPVFPTPRRFQDLDKYPSLSRSPKRGSSSPFLVPQFPIKYTYFLRFAGRFLIGRVLRYARDVWRHVSNRTTFPSRYVHALSTTFPLDSPPTVSSLFPSFPPGRPRSRRCLARGQKYRSGGDRFNSPLFG